MALSVSAASSAGHSPVTRVAISRCRAMAGLTLLELLIALTVLTTLGVMTYRATTAAIGTYSHLQVSEQRWSGIVRALHIIETELLQMVHAGRVELTWQPASTVISGEDEAELARLAMLSLGGAQGSERVAFVLRGTRLYWERSSARDVRPEPQQDVLLEGVESIEWQLLGREGWVSEWNRPQTPRAVRLSFTVQGLGEFHRVFALF